MEFTHYKARPHPPTPSTPRPLLGAGPAGQAADKELQAIFAPVAEKLTANEAKIAAELLAVQGKPTNVGGYYQPDDKLASAARRPSQTLNDILAQL